MVGATALTKPPTNLKEAIDWLALVGGYGRNDWGGSGKHTELEEALKKLPGFEKVKTKVFNRIEPQGVILKLAKGLGYEFLGYQGQGVNTFSGQGIIQHGQGYMSKYDNASWPSTDPELQKCALIFLGCAVTVYYCITYLFWQCTKGGWQRMNFGGSNGYGLYSFRQAVGYNDGSVSNTISGEEIAKRLGEGYDSLEELKTASEAATSNNYSGFLQKLEDYDSGEALKHPLASCLKLAKEYFASKNANEITKVMQKIKETLIYHSTKKEFSSSGDYNDVKELITQLLSAVKDFTPDKEAEKFGQGVHPAAGKVGKGTENSISAQPSPAGPVAGTLTTISLGGGAAAAYLLNLGGAKTLVNGLLKIG